MGKVEIVHECQVCYNKFVDSDLIAVNGIRTPRGYRVFPWNICKLCAEKISDDLKQDKERMIE